MASSYKKVEQCLAWTSASPVMFVQGRNVAVSSFRHSLRNVSSIKKCRYPLQVTVMTNDSFNANFTDEKKNDSDKIENQDQYAAFSKMLGVEDQSPTPSKPSTDNVVVKAKERKVEIDQRDYDMFNALLEKSGGTGRKPMKGSKKYQTVSLNIPSAPVEKKQLQDTLEVRSDINDENQMPSSTSPTNIVEETDDGYMFMMEEFGSGIHDHQTLNRSSDDDKEQRASSLLQKPNLPERGYIAAADFTEKNYTLDPSSLLSKPENRSSSVINPAPALHPKPILSSNKNTVGRVSEYVDVKDSDKEKQLPSTNSLLVPPIRNRENSLNEQQATDGTREINAKIEGEGIYMDSHVSLRDALDEGSKEKEKDPVTVSQVLKEKPQFPANFTSQLGIDNTEKNFMMRRERSRRPLDKKMLRLENPQIITERN